VRIRSAAELEHYLKAMHPEHVEIEYREEDVPSGRWNEEPEVHLLHVARRFGYDPVGRRTGGKAPIFKWMGRGDRYVIFRLENQWLPRPCTE